MTTVTYQNPLIGSQEADRQVSMVVAQMLNHYARTLGPDEAGIVLEPLAQQARLAPPADASDQARHGRMAAHWLINNLYPAALETAPVLREHARSLRKASPWPHGPEQQDPQGEQGVTLYNVAEAIAEAALQERQMAWQRRQQACGHRTGSLQGRVAEAYRILERAGHGAAIHALWAAGEVGLLACGIQKLTGASLDALTAAHHDHFTDRWLAQRDLRRRPTAADPLEMVNSMRQSLLKLLTEMTRPEAETQASAKLGA